VPLVGTLHDPIPHTGHRVVIGGIDLRQRARISFSRFLTVCFVHGPQCKQQAISAGYPERKIETVPHGLYTHFKTSDGDDQDPEYDLLLFGNIRPNKGYDRVPEIIDIVRGEYPDLSVLVAGSPSNDVTTKEEVEQTVTALRRHKHVTLRAEYIPNEEVSRLFRNTKLVVLPYYDATASGVLMSAYTFGKPVVVTDTGEIGRIVREDGTGLVAEANSNEEIATKIIELLNDPDKRAQMESRIRDARTKYEWDSIARDVVTVYEGLSPTVGE